MEKEELIQRCLISDDAVVSYPFNDKIYSDIAVIRHKSNKKWFALIFKLDGILYVNLKCDSYESLALRDLYPFVTPAWHMNKKHWNKVDVEKATDEILDNLIKVSYDLTADKNKKKK